MVIISADNSPTKMFIPYIITYKYVVLGSVEQKSGVKIFSIWFNCVHIHQAYHFLVADEMMK
jgi:hypothetical protein